MKSNLRNEIKSYIVRQGLTMQEVVDLLADEYCRMAELSAIWDIRSYLRGTAGGKVLRMDAGTGQEHLKRRNLYRQQRTQQADQYLLQEQEKGTQAAGGMVQSGEYPRSHCFQGSL